jgi:hypothetical protein
MKTKNSPRFDLGVLRVPKIIFDKFNLSKPISVAIFVTQNDGRSLKKDTNNLVNSS